MKYKYLLAMVFGITLAQFGFPITTYQYWILIWLFAINGAINI